MAFRQAQQSVVSHRKSRKSRKTLRLAQLLNLDRYAVVERLVAQWPGSSAWAGLLIERTRQRTRKGGKA